MMQNNLKIAITGGIGSGKSEVLKIIKEQGYSTVSCDEIYRELLRDRTFIQTLVNEFGDILKIDGSLDRDKLSSIVFNDRDKLKRLDEITHPRILEECLKAMPQDGISFCEVPILFECGYERLFDNVIVVLRDKSLRISAVVERDKISENKVVNRINSQLNYENLQFEKYYVIHNSSNLAYLTQQTLEILEKIVKK